MSLVFAAHGPTFKFDLWVHIGLVWWHWTGLVVIHGLMYRCREESEWSVWPLSICVALGMVAGE
jgi:hypothetical protein